MLRGSAGVLWYLVRPPLFAAPANDRGSRLALVFISCAVSHIQFGKEVVKIPLLCREESQPRRPLFLSRKTDAHHDGQHYCPWHQDTALRILPLLPSSGTIRSLPLRLQCFLLSLLPVLAVSLLSCAGHPLARLSKSNCRGPKRTGELHKVQVSLPRAPQITVLFCQEAVFPVNGKRGCGIPLNSDSRIEA